MEKSRDAAQRKKALKRLQQEAEKAQCAACGEKVGIEDRCSDGRYLHRACAYQYGQR